MKVSVYGIGYVGLVQAAVLAQVGHDVLCVDIDEEKIAKLKQGIIPIYEPGLSSLVKENYEQGRLTFTTSAKEGVEHAEIQCIAVGTPPTETGAADLSQVLTVASVIATHMQGYKLVLTKSTVPVGTGDKIRSKIASTLNERQEVFDYDVVSNPEFLKEGCAVSDCQKPDRIIVGFENKRVKPVMKELYAPFNRNHDKMMFMDIRSAELTKYAANCMLATKISFMNEMATIAETLGADIEMVRQGIGSDPRIGYQFIYPGCGYGGSCFPKDVKGLIQSAQEMDYVPSVLTAVDAVNIKQKHKLFEKICEHFRHELKGKQFAIWGLSFKPDTDDMREASSQVLIDKLLEVGASVRAFDPKAMDECQKLFGQSESFMLMGTKESCLVGSDALVICTEWRQFRAPDFNLISDTLSQPLIFDGRNLYDPELMEEKGYAYYGIGRGRSIKKESIV